MKTIYTFSSLRTFQTCPFSYYVKYRLGYRPIKIDMPLKFGNAIHKWLELQDNEISIDDFLEKYPIDDSYEEAKFKALCLGYQARYDYLVSESTNNISEHVFEVKLSTHPNAVVMGKMDDLFFLNDKHVILVEHKTSGEDIQPGGYYWQKLQIDTQIGLYWIALISQGYKPEHVLYNVIGKPDIRSSKATPIEKRKYKKDGSLYKNQREFDESPEEYYDRLVEDIASRPEKYYQRGQVFLLKEDLLGLKNDILKTIDMIEGCENQVFWPRFSGNCYKYNKPCPIFPVCTNETDLSNTDRYYQSDDFHPELKQEEEENESND